VTTAVPTARARKRGEARRLLEAFDLEGVVRWAAETAQAPMLLQGLLSDPDELTAWRAVEGLAAVTEARSRADPEPARDLLRRVLWLMNDESGGLLWFGPQVYGAVLARIPALGGEPLGILASFLEEEPFRAGTRWGLWRVAAARPEAAAAVAASHAAALAASARDRDPLVRGCAALALHAAGGPEAAAPFAGDGEPVAVFDFRTGALRPTTVGQAAAGAF